MDSVLYSPDRDTLHGARCPNSSQVQQLGGSVYAWCWILADSGRFLARGLGLNLIILVCGNTMCLHVSQQSLYGICPEVLLPTAMTGPVKFYLPSIIGPTVVQR